MANIPIETAKAGLFTKWIESIIGSRPAIVVITDTQDDHVEVHFSPEQQRMMIAWLDKQLWDSWKPNRDKGDLRIEFGPILMSWAARYIVPSAGAVFAAGYATKGFRNLFGGRR